MGYGLFWIENTYYADINPLTPEFDLTCRSLFMNNNEGLNFHD